MTSKTEQTSAPYAAALLFQYSVKELPGVMRTCERRIVHVEARSYKDALRKAEKIGRKDKRRYMNSDGNTVQFDFVAVIDLINMDHVEPGDPEVWYDIVQIKTPLERKSEFEVKLGPDGWPMRKSKANLRLRPGP